MGKLIRLELNSLLTPKVSMQNVLTIRQTSSHTRIIILYSWVTLTSPPSLAPMARVNPIRKPSNCHEYPHRRLTRSLSMDAISFVLGIKSSHLRSTHLRDLVYRGRVLRTSTVNGDGSSNKHAANGHTTGDGASDEEGTTNGTHERNDPKSAWVMAVYEDDAGDEQLWKRTITNQGSSEYRLNNQVVTAQQYNEALEAENILIKARNFLVFQGDVEAIASQSSRDLTRLIEQISGSLEYKAEYEKLRDVADEALELQTHNLNRRRGLGSEIKQYKEQKVEADNYAKKADERDQAIVAHILWKLYHFQRVIEESEADILKHQEELKEHRRGIEKYEHGLEEAKKDQAKVGRDVSKVERSIKKIEKDIEEKENSLVPIAEKIDITNNSMKKCSDRVNVISKERDSQSASVKQSTKDLKIVEKAQAQWETEWKKLAEQEGRELSGADIQTYNKLKEDVNKRTSADQVKVDNLTRQKRADEGTVNSLKSKLDSAQWQVEKLENELGEISDRKEIFSVLVKQTSKDIDSKKKDYNKVTSERTRSAQLRTEKDEQLQEVLNKLLDAEDGRKQNEKELRLKATIADMKRIFPGVKGRISELCKPTQKKYGDAVSTVLGRHFDSIVVDNEKTAKDCIQYLRDQRRGQATFIPLDTIQWKTVNSSLKGVHRGTRMAIDTIEFDKSLERAMSFVCGDAIVCDDWATAKYIRWEKGIEAKAVTLDGTVIHKGSLVTGGQGKERNSRRWEDTETDNLRKLAEKLRSEIYALPDFRRNAQEEETLQGDLTGLDEKLNYAKSELRSLERNQSSKENELSHAQQENAAAKPKYEERLQEYEELKGNLKSFQDAVSEVEDEVFADFCTRLGYDNIRVYEAQQGSLQQEGAHKKLEFNTQKSRLESRMSFEQQQLKEVNKRIKTLEDRMKQDQSLISELETEKLFTQNEIDTLNAELEELNEQLKQSKAKYDKKAEKVSEQRREFQKRNKTAEGTLKAIAGLEAEMQVKATERYTLLRRCKLEDISIPLQNDSNSLDDLPIDAVAQPESDAMDVDEDPNASSLPKESITDHGIQVSFDDLDEDLKEVGFSKFPQQLK